MTQEFAKIEISDSKGFSDESTRAICPASDNFRKVEMLDHEYSGADLTVASGFDSDESGRAFFVSGDYLDFLSESGESIQ